MSDQQKEFEKFQVQAKQRRDRPEALNVAEDELLRSARALTRKYEQRMSSAKSDFAAMNALTAALREHEVAALAYSREIWLRMAGRLLDGGELAAGMQQLFDDVLAIVRKHPGSLP